MKNSRTATPLGFNTGLRAGTALLAWNHRCRHDTISPAGTKRDPAPALPVAMNDEPVRACPHRGKHAGDRSTRRASVESRGHDDQDRKSVVEGKGVYVRVDLGGRRY